MSSNNRFDNFIEEYIVEQDTDVTVFGDESIGFDKLNSDIGIDNSNSDIGIDNSNSDIGIEHSNSSIKESSPWNDKSISLLLNLRLAYDDKFKKGGQGKKNIVWKQISADMHKKGIGVDGKTCDEKFRRMKTNYTKLHDQSKQTGRGPVRWKWFKDMENIIHTKDTASPPKDMIYETLIAKPVQQLPCINTITESQTLVSPTQSTQKINSLLKTTKPSWVKEMMDAKEKQFEFLKAHGDKMEKRMLEIGGKIDEDRDLKAKLLKSLENSNAIEQQKLDLFKEMFTDKQNSS